MKLNIKLFIGCAFLFLGACTDTEMVSMEQISKGSRLYDMHCANCHQKDGSGLAQLIPPLKDSDFLKANKSQLTYMIYLGLNGMMMVNDKSYTAAMPPNKKLSAHEIACISAYVYQKFLNESKYFSDSLIESQILNCKKAGK